MTAFQVACIAALILLALFGRAYHYKTVFGYWAWGRLRPGDADRLLLADSCTAYWQGFEAGEDATRRKIVNWLRSGELRGQHLANVFAAAIESKFGGKS